MTGLSAQAVRSPRLACGVVGNRPLTVELLASSNSHQLQQIFTGHGQLATLGAIKLSQRIVGKHQERARSQQRPHVSAVVDGRLRIHYDMDDRRDVCMPALQDAFVYFKRSFDPVYLQSQCKDRILYDKIMPFGLYYQVYSNDSDLALFLRAVRLDRGRRRWRNMLLALGLDRMIPPKMFYASRCDRVRYYPMPLKGDAKTLFLTAAWDPQRAPSEEAAQDREAINMVRADCIRRLRRELGPRFLGGFRPTRFAERCFPDCLAPSEMLTRQASFHGLLRKYEIAIATHGLWRSVGAKMAEYVAHARAIVSEHLTNTVPGPFAPGTNYLAFTSPDEAVAHVFRLMDDQDMRYQMMWANFAYFHSYVRPDVAVVRCLCTALAIAEKQHAYD